MFGKNLVFYRQRQNLTKKALAAAAGVTPQAISNYENGKRMPEMEVIKRLADILQVKVIDFLAIRNENLVFQHAEFRKHSKLRQNRQSYIRGFVEDYFGRFFEIVECLGGEVLPVAPAIHAIPLPVTPEEAASALRDHLGLACEGPVLDLVAILENKGILVILQKIDERSFFGMNGTVNGRPYIIVNTAMNAARMRTTIVHELAHIMFVWPDSMADNEIEQMATAISGAFLLPARDALRELGLKRSRISNDMASVCNEYGVSMFLLAKRARLCGIISELAERQFYIKANAMGWRNNEPERCNKENTFLFEQLVCRAICEDQISLQKGTELLQMSITDLIQRCNFADGDE